MYNYNFYILGTLSNSHKKIEPEIMHQIMTDSYVNSIINSSEMTKGLDFLITDLWLDSWQKLTSFQQMKWKDFG